MKNNFLEPELIYEDEYLLVYNKPAGLSVQTAKVAERDLESIARAHVYDQVSRGEAEPVDVHIVHRLDQPVSGIVVLAKGGKAAAALSKSFGGKLDNQSSLGAKSGNNSSSGLGAVKTYTTLVKGSLPETEGELIDYLVKDGKTNTSRVVTEDHPGDIKASGAKKAVLEYKFLYTIGEYTLYEVTLLTGRHHQIRVQLSHMGCPIVGDYKYGYKDKDTETTEGTEGDEGCKGDGVSDNRISYDGLCLCASAVEFPHPKKKGRMMKFEVKPGFVK